MFTFDKTNITKMRQLKVIMAEKGITVQELSKLTKLSKTTISKLRQDGTTTKMKNLYLIAEKLNVEPKDLLNSTIKL